MKKSQTRRILLLLGCAVLLVCLSVGATLAYLTSQTAPVVNTFTVGNVQIKLDETDVDLYGKKDSENRVMANDYKLLPGHTYTKDPTVTVLANSEDCYVRVLVTVTEKAALDTLFAKYNLTTELRNIVPLNSEWTYIDVTVIDNTRVYEIRYNSKVQLNSADQKLPAVFGEIKVPGTITNDDLATLNGMKINVVAQAVQADGFDTAADAWAATFDKSVTP